MDKDKIESLTTKLIQDRDEHLKVDFKSKWDFDTKLGKVKLSKLISAIANSDTPVLDNVMYW